ncbi:MAG TPA: ABC transporter ATP-binding protein [Streptosporangiaceae bacterium]|nr:ABC transporter ATP-binding protein [Streptosporangiaceae bacterium]
MGASATTSPDSAAGGTVPLLSVRNLSVEFRVDGGEVQAVRDISFDLNAGEVLGLVGESGSGKSVSMSSLLRLNPSPPARITGGSVLFQGTDLLALSERQLRRFRGREIAMIFQDPAMSLNPVQTIGSQITEAMQVHDRGLSRRDARTRAVELLDLVGVPSPTVRYSQYPHEFSGGMRQRAMIAMALSNRPKLLIADEPTTALDVTVQAQILDLLQDIQREENVSIILITHDIGIIAEVADRVLVMYAGKVVETAGVRPLFETPLHPYTRGLLASLPRLDAPGGDLPSIPGQPPSLNPPPSGCAFHPRCALSAGRERCRTELPDLADAGEQHDVACHFFAELGDPALPGTGGDPATTDLDRGYAR